MCGTPADDVFTLFNSHPEGLDPDEAKRRLEKDGYNEVASRQEHGPIYQFLKQFTSPLIYLLLIAAAITFFLDQIVDTIVILFVVLANAVIGFIQEGKAQNALKSLAKLLVPEARVLRGGASNTIPSRELVVGDIVLLESGNRVPADMRLFYTKNLRVDESILTGESVPVAKTSDIITVGCESFADQKNMVFASTLISQGQGKGIVVATGSATQIGKISEFIRESKEISTPLIQKMAQMSVVLSVAIVAVAAATFGIGMLRGYETIDMFMASVSLAVAAIPEGLPAVITISMAIGVNRMAAKNTIIRTMPAVETLGSATVICTDKTGTLTKNQMTVTQIYVDGRHYDVTGIGYRPEGEFLSKGERIDPMADSVLVEVLRAGVLCNDASLRGNDIDGDPTEAALLISGIKAGKFGQPRIDVIPFESEHRFMATLHTKDDSSNVIYVKGSPETILNMCSSQFDGQNAVPLDHDAVIQASERMASEALRVLGMAYKEVPSDISSIEPDDIKDMVFIGLQGMMDPPRDGVPEAVHACKTAGIRVIMITGDHLSTAYAIATRIGIETKGALAGKDIEKMSDEQFSEVLRSVSVFARTSPEDKLRIVKLLKQSGEVVAVTGDGINDAPALKTADIGISMGITGTEVAKDASNVVLADDNFSSIVAAIEEGRDVYSKIQKILLWTLPTNGGQGLTIVLGVLLGVATLPLVPLQVLWLNTVTAIGLGVPITMEPKERGILERPPRPPKEPIITSLIIRRIVFVSLLIVAGAYLNFYIKLGDGGSIPAARTVALNAIMFFQIFFLFNSKSMNEYVYKDLFSNKYMNMGIVIVLLLQLLITYHPYMNMIFSTAPILIKDWLMITLISSTVFFLIEFEKYLCKKGYLS